MLATKAFNVGSMAASYMVWERAFLCRMHLDRGAHGSARAIRDRLAGARRRKTLVGLFWRRVAAAKYSD
jgi:hypothetical protein